MNDYRYAYLHGFGSSPASHKGQALNAAFSARGLDVERPDLNRPSFARLDHDAMAAALDDLDRRVPGGPWRFVGSSLGGWLAAYWASLHPQRVDRLVLLCPGFNLAERWPDVIGGDGFEAWERAGQYRFPDASGSPVAVHWGFIESARRLPGSPVVPCPTRIIHGTRDGVVPIESSRRYAERHAVVSLREVDDDHALVASMALILTDIWAHFELSA